MARLLYLTSLAAAAAATSTTVGVWASSDASPQMVPAGGADFAGAAGIPPPFLKSPAVTEAPKLSKCRAPITFVCNNDATPKPVAGPMGPSAASSGSGGGGESVFSIVFDSVSSLIGNVIAAATPSFGGGSDDQSQSGGYSSAAHHHRDAATDRKAAFYSAADSGSECRVLTSSVEGLSGPENPLAGGKVYPNPSEMVQSERDVSHFHVICGDTSDFYESSKALVVSRMPKLKSSLASDAEVMADITKAGLFPHKVAAEKAVAEQTKLRNTALIIVPGGSYSTLSIYESLVMPLEVLFEQSNRTTSTAATSSSSAPAAGGNANATTTTTLHPNDFVPIVVQYRVTPRSPQGPQEDISKAIRMLERHRQKRLVSSLAPATGGDANNNNDAAAGGTPQQFGGDDSDMGFADAERKRSEEEKAQTRLSPAMLGLTDDFKIIIAGFSAGGHAAATYAAMTSTIPIAAAVLVYPVIAMDKPALAHYYSTMNLLDVEPNMTVPVNPNTKNKKNTNNGNINKEASGSQEGGIAKSLKEEPVPAPPTIVAAAEEKAARRFAAQQQHVQPADKALFPVPASFSDAHIASAAAEAKYKRETERYEKAQTLLQRYSPYHYPANFPACVYLTSTANDPVVNVENSHLMYDSLIEYRRRREEKAAGGMGLKGSAAGGGIKAEESAVAPNAAAASSSAQHRGFQPAAIDESSNTNSGAAASSNYTTRAPIKTTFFESDYGVGIRVYPDGPHGRWWVDQVRPELRRWWGDALAFLDENGC